MSDNGASPAEDIGLAAHIETTAAKRRQVVGELRELHDAEQAIVEGLTRQVGEAKARRDGYKRALDGIGGAAEKAKPRRQPGRVYRPGDEYLSQLVEILRNSPEPLSQAQLAELVDFSSETLGRALTTLRNEDKVRVAARHGLRNLYGLMPDA